MKQRIKWMLCGSITGGLFPLGLWVVHELLRPQPAMAVWVTYGFVLVSGAISCGIISYVIKKYIDQEAALRLRDPLTSLLTRQTVLLHLHEILGKNKEFGEGFCAVFLQLDNFSTINKEYGDKSGDELIQLMAGNIQRVLSGKEFAGRYNGTSFLLLFPLWPLKKVQARARKIQRNVEKRGASLLSAERVSVSGVIYPVAGETTLSETELLRKIQGGIQDVRNRGGNQILVIE